MPPLRLPSVRLSIVAGSAALALAGAGAAIAVPAYASALQQERYDAASQHLDLTARTAPITIAPRDGVTVTQLTPVQWPIDPASPISSPFGHRVAPCGGCSTAHQGVDLTPGAGTPVAAIADGTVVEAGVYGELGEHVTIRNDADGEVVTSVYGHLIAGTMPLHPGDTVARGQILGRVGSTGESTGTHLHFGILDAGGTAIDPLGWMRAHVTQTWGAPAAG
ncbi:M23 family metallopeptidase [Pseudolysinimonas sp.]|uniref:M23 family metallopeptidase n=1 Tax=Pseudolysinimonas sp. TaxID=2680009 RepID=UPI003F7D2801